MCAAIAMRQQQASAWVDFCHAAHSTCKDEDLFLTPNSSSLLGKNHDGSVS
jgi:hypothetical protein